MSSEADQTIPEEGTGSPSSERGLSGLSLVIASCPEQPWRVGDIALLPSESGRTFVFGRGEGDPSDTRPRLRFVRRSHVAIEAAPAITLNRISREQAALHVKSGGELEVENLGRCPLVVSGAEVTRTRVGGGDVIQFGQQLLLLCVPTAALPPGPPEGFSNFQHGGADAFGIVGESPVMWRLRHQIAFIAAREGHVLVLGPSGTGKELVARAIHALSRRRDRAMVCRNAATIPDALVDAELFGNIKNYPNVGMQERPGLVGEADGSTLFLDELAELPVAQQAHLLRLLDAGEYQRLGDARARRADLRLIGATNRGENALKEDLRARFQFRLHVPDLGQRREDIPFLVRHLLGTFAAQPAGLPGMERDAAGQPQISINVMRRLVVHAYRTNVRELSSLLWDAIATERHGPAPAVRSERPSTRPSLPPPSEPAPTPDEDAGDDPSPERVRRVLRENNGRLEATWRALGLKNRYVLRRLLQKWDIEIERRPSKRR